MSETRDYRRHDLTGQRFGRLVAVKRGENDKNNHTTWWRWKNDIRRSN